MPKPTQQPSFLANATAFYGEAFDHRTQKAIARSMAEWAELDEDEQSFALAHLQFLGLQAQAATQRLLVQVRDLLDEVAENLTVALEASLPEEDELAADEPGEDDLVDALPALQEVTAEPEPDDDALEDLDEDQGGEE